MSTDPSTRNAAALVRRASSAYNAADFDQAVEHSRAALIMLENLTDSESLTLLDEAFERLVMSFQRSGRYAAAREAILEWRACTRREAGRARTLIHEGRLESFAGSFDRSGRLLDQAIAVAEAAGDRAGVGTAKRIQADICWKQGHTEKALAISQEALAILEQAGDFEQQAGTHVSLAAAYHHLGQFFKAIQALQRAARLVEELGRQYELAIVLNNLGETYAELYMMDRALEYHQRALRLVGLDRANPDLIRNLGAEQVVTGAHDEGLRNLNLALERARAINDPDMIGQVLHSLAEASLADNNLDQAEIYGAELLQIAARLDAPRHRIRASMTLGEVARRRGDHKTAQTYFNDCSLMAHRSADSNTIWQIHAALSEMLRETMPPLAQVHRQIAAEMMRTILDSIDDPGLRQAFRRAAPVCVVLGSA